MTTPISFTVKPPPSTSARPSSLANGSGSRHQSRVGAPSRRMFQDGGEDSDEDVGFERRKTDRVKEERVEGFSNGRLKGDRSNTPKDQPLVIPALPNRDWRESSRRVPTYTPQTQKQEGDLVTHERTGDGPQRAGLRRAEREVKQEPDQDIKPDISADNKDGSSTNANGLSNGQSLTLEQRALQELLSGRRSPSPSSLERQSQIIAMQENRVLTEGEALRRDTDNLPDGPTMDDFEAVPIEGFGAAVLRGMGWDPKAADNVKAREVKRRPQLLGLGATPMATEVKPTHGKNKDKRSHAERTGRGYNAASLLVKKEREGNARAIEGSNGSGRTTPVLNRDTDVESEGSRRRRRDDEDTGRESKRRDDRSESDRRDERDRYRSDRERDRDGRDGRDRREDRDRRDGRDRQDDRDRERARERDRDRERARERDRDRDGRRYETEEERARRKEREREKERQRQREGRSRDDDQRRGYRD